ncbi:unnamed protein product, partial [Laminaria digitata]
SVDRVQKKSSVKRTVSSNSSIGNTYIQNLKNKSGGGNKNSGSSSSRISSNGGGSTSTSKPVVNNGSKAGRIKTSVSSNKNKNGDDDDSSKTNGGKKTTVVNNSEITSNTNINASRTNIAASNNSKKKISSTFNSTENRSNSNATNGSNTSSNSNNNNNDDDYDTINDYDTSDRNNNYDTINRMNKERGAAPATTVGDDNSNGYVLRNGLTGHADLIGHETVNEYAPITGHEDLNGYGGGFNGLITPGSCNSNSHCGGSSYGEHSSHDGSNYEGIELHDVANGYVGHNGNVGGSNSRRLFSGSNGHGQANRNVGRKGHGFYKAFGRRSASDSGSNSESDSDSGGGHLTTRQRDEIFRIKREKSVAAA